MNIAGELSFGRENFYEQVSGNLFGITFDVVPFVTAHKVGKAATTSAGASSVSPRISEVHTESSRRGL